MIEVIKAIIKSMQAYFLLEVSSEKVFNFLPPFKFFMSFRHCNILLIYNAILIVRNVGKGWYFEPVSRLFIFATYENSTWLFVFSHSNLTITFALFLWLLTRLSKFLQAKNKLALSFHSFICFTIKRVIIGVPEVEKKIPFFSIEINHCKCLEIGVVLKPQDGIFIFAPRSLTHSFITRMTITYVGERINKIMTLSNVITFIWRLLRKRQHGPVVQTTNKAQEQ